MKKIILLLLFVCSIAVLSSCTKSNYSVNPNTNTVTTTPTVPNNQSTLAGTKWVLYQYKDATTQNPLPKNDTLVFIDALNYTYNSQPNTYELKTSNITGYWSLRFYSTPFGNIIGQPATNFKTYGEITDVPFTQIGPSNPVIYSLWMKKI